MNTTTIAVVASEETLGLPVGPMSDSEKQDRDNHHHKIKACSEGIGAALSHIYNHRLFRGDDGRQSWKDYVEGELPEWLGEKPSIDVADFHRWLHEARRLIPAGGSSPRYLPSSNQQAKALQSLIPRREVRHEETGGVWYPAILDDPDAAKGIAKVWNLACQNAEANKRRKRHNGPTAKDVRAAREELRPELEERGWIRSAPASFQAATAARVEAARQRTIDVTPSNAAEQNRFNDTMANIRDTKAERQAKVEVDHVRQQLDAAEAERRHVLEEQVRLYNSRLHAASKTIHDLLVHMETLSRVHGTQFLAEMRSIEVLGLITVKDDMQRLQEMGTDLMKVVRLARSCDPPSGVNMQTIDL